jgi:signal transduction histidine kinase
MIGIGREVEARRKDGSVFPVDLAVNEVEHLKLFTGIIRDITRRKELEREVAEIASLEQQNIGQDLHDSVGQELVALMLLADDVAEIHQTDPANTSPLIQQLIQGLQRCQLELRTVLRGLLPVPVEREGLMAALAELAHRIQRDSKVLCVFDCPQQVSVEDNLTATHLYLIAQEATYNAVKHAQARNIRINLETNPTLILRVQDDGIGMSAQAVPRVPTAVGGGEASRLGLRVMRNRAAIIGAELTIEPARPSGTVVTCALATKKAFTGRGV